MFRSESDVVQLSSGSHSHETDFTGFTSELAQTLDFRRLLLIAHATVSASSAALDITLSKAAGDTVRSVLLLSLLAIDLLLSRSSPLAKCFVNLWGPVPLFFFFFESRKRPSLPNVHQKMRIKKEKAEMAQRKAKIDLLVI